MLKRSGSKNIRKRLGILRGLKPALILLNSLNPNAPKARPNASDETIKEIRIVGEKVNDVSRKLDKTNELLERRFERIERIKKALIKAGIEL